MKHEAKKISKIVDELLTYFLHHYNVPTEIRVVPERTQYTIQIKLSDIDISDRDFAELKKRLVVKRQPELEDYYWQLAGEVEDANEMLLVAMMCDSITMDRDGRDVRLTLVRKA